MGALYILIDGIVIEHMPTRSVFRHVQLHLALDNHLFNFSDRLRRI